MKKLSEGVLLNKTALFLKLFLPYLMLLIIPIIIGTIVYSHTINLISSNILIENESKIMFIQNLIDQMEIELENIYIETSTNPKIMRFMYFDDPYEYPNAYRVNETRLLLNRRGVKNSFIHDYFIFFNKSQLVLGREIAYTYKQFYDIAFDYISMDYNTWVDTIRAYNLTPRYVHFENAKMFKKDMEIIGYKRSFEKNLASLFVIINESEIHNIFKKMNISDKGFIYIVHKNGNLLTSFGDVVNIHENIEIGDEIKNETITYEGTEYLVTHVSSKNSNLYFVIAEPLSVVLKQVSYIRTIAYAATFAILLFGILISLYASKRNIKPFTELIIKVYGYISKNSKNAEADKKTIGIQTIKDAVFELIDQNTHLELTIVERQPFVKSWLISSLLNGDYELLNDNYERKVIEYILKDFIKDFNNKLYMVSIIRFIDRDKNKMDGTKDMSLPLSLKSLQIEVNRIIESNLPQNTLTYLVASDMIVVIYHCDYVDAENKKSKFSKLIESVLSSVQPDIKRNIQIANGGIYREYTGIQKSYKEAKELLFFRMGNLAGDVVWYEELEKVNKKIYSLPVEEQIALLNLTLAGDTEGVNNLLEKLFSKYILPREDDCRIYQVFLYELWGILFKAIDKARIDTEAEYNKLVQMISNIEKLSIIDQLPLIKECFSTICNFISTYKDKNSILVKRIIECVECEYSNSDFSIQKIADLLGYTVTHVSNVFKQETGENLSKYIERFRIEKAVSLLKETSLNINEIAEKVGYSSANTFCRAFKRVMGINATQLRNM